MPTRSLTGVAPGRLGGRQVGDPVGPDQGVDGVEQGGAVLRDASPDVVRDLFATVLLGFRAPVTEPMRSPSR